MLREEVVDLIHFTWKFPDHGYVWDDEARPDKLLGATGRPPFLLVSPAAKTLRRYCPLPQDEQQDEGIPPLFARFANLHPTREAIREFASKYGWLGIGNDVVSQHHPGIVAVGESRDQWRLEISELRLVLRSGNFLLFVSLVVPT